VLSDGFPRAFTAMLVQLVARAIGYVPLYALFLFVPAGTLRWWQAWVFLAVMLGVQAVTTVSVSRVNMSVLRERGRFPLHPGQALADRVLLISNAFASTVVRYQAERGHTVVNTGIYRVVRHPMYAGLIPTLVGMCLWLQSYAAALLVVVPIGILVARIVLEERLLGKELGGYDTYVANVRYRLIPGVW
jgi:protein-S-isoprenylcysteine O-methyltransferase Ste14